MQRSGVEKRRGWPWAVTAQVATWLRRPPTGCAPRPGRRGCERFLLLYPATDHPSGNHLSYTETEMGYGLEANLMRWFWEQYARWCFAGRSRCVTASITYTASASPNFGGNGGV